MNIESLLALGFTYEELYQKGLLVAAPEQDPAPADPAPEDPAPADPAPADPAPADPSPETNETIEALRNELAELKTAIQNLNIKNAERSGAGAPSEQISVEDAIIGLVKEM